MVTKSERSTRKVKRNPADVRVVQDSWLVRPIRSLGKFIAMFVDTLRAMYKRPFQWRELLEQTAFIASVATLPAILLTIPTVVTVVFLLNQLLSEIGAIDLAGAGTGLAVIKEIGPLAAVIVVAGAGATAITADLGSRKIREELDAMEVLGVDPIHRLVAPRVLAMTFVAFGLNGIVSIVGISGGFFFSVLVQGASPGLFIDNITLLVGLDDFVLGQFKALVFGFVAGNIACFRGLNVAGGPKGVGQAVNETVVYTFVALFFFHVLITMIALPFIR